jgi:predicted nucleic acid-binding protein
VNALPAERLVCDTSFVGHSAKRSARPERYVHWPAETLARIDAAILAISVITLAEARYGYLNAGWGPARIDREERRLAGFLQIPLDPTVVDEWARLRVLSRQNGWNVGDNDLWIAATASARRHALVTCDADQARIVDPGLEVLHLPAPQ